MVLLVSPQKAFFYERRTFSNHHTELKYMIEPFKIVLLLQNYILICKDLKSFSEI